LVKQGQTNGELEDWFSTARAFRKYISELALYLGVCMAVLILLSSPFYGISLYSAYIAGIPGAYALHHYNHKNEVFFYNNLYLSFGKLRALSLVVFVSLPLIYLVGVIVSG